MARKPRIDPSLLQEFWEIERHNLCLGGVMYLTQRVYICCAKTKQEVKDGIVEFKKRTCK